MPPIKFFHPEDLRYVRVADYFESEFFDKSSGTGAAMVAKMPQEEMYGQEVGYYFAGSSSELQLFEVRCQPDLTFHAHAHTEDEIFYVLSGEIILGRRRYPPGSAVYIPAYTLYAFASGPEGLRFLNFRPRRDETYITREELSEIRGSKNGGNGEIA